MTGTDRLGAAERRPNVIWVMVDQMRAQATGYAGDPNVHTPNLDRLAAEGANFHRAVSGAPLCCPFRGSLVTGRYPHNSGVAGHQHPLPTEVPTVATAFGEAGYRTCWVGKWHLDGNRPELGDASVRSGDERTRMIPVERRGGFEDWWAYENNNRPFDCFVHTDKGRTPSDCEVLASGNGMETFRLGGYEVDSLTDIMLGWLGEQTQQRSAQPFFAVLSVQPPHNPYTAPEAEMGRHTPGQVKLRPNVPPVDRVTVRAQRDLAGYYAAIERIDRNLGRLREKLEELGIADDTYVIFFSDHGDMHGSHGQWRKTSPWEESVRVPFVIGGPSREHQNSLRVDVPINHVDIGPTSLGLCGITAPPTMEGFDYSSWMRRNPFAPDDGGDEPDSAYLGIPVPTGHPESVDRSWRGVVTRDNWKYVCLEGLPWLLFDLNEDPYELANLAHDRTYRAKREELHDRLERWIADTGDSFELTR